MPATRRTASGPASKGAQSTLSFGGNRSKITKPTTTVKAKDAKETINTPESPSQSAGDLPPSEDVASPISPKLEEPEEPKPEATPIAPPVNLPVPTVDETKARRVKDKEIHSYWQAREDERKTPRVHQQDLSLQEKILRHFDLSSQYGPCIGITRLARWKRASKLGLHPPIEVLAVLLQEADKTKVGSEIKGQTAYIDELLGGRSAIEV